MIISSRPVIEMVPLEPAAWEGRVLCSGTRIPATTRASSRSTSSRSACCSLVEEAGGPDRGAHGRAPGPVPHRLRGRGRSTTGSARATRSGMFQVESRAQIQMIRGCARGTWTTWRSRSRSCGPGPIVGGA
jgi:hypothetical protein